MSRKLTDQDVIDIRLSKLPSSVLAGIYNKSPDSIRKCRTGKTYSNIKIKGVPYQFRQNAMTEEQVITARSGLKTTHELSREFGFSKKNIKYAMAGNTHKEVKGYTTDKDFKSRILNRRQLRIINYFLERGYLSYPQLAKHFKVSTQTIHKLNTYDSRPKGRPRKFNQITYTYFKVLYDQLGSYQKVADKVGAKEANVYKLLTGYRT